MMDLFVLTDDQDMLTTVEHGLKRPHLNECRYAMVVFDGNGCGRECPAFGELRDTLQTWFPTVSA